jgi:hypothetical protein
MKGCAIMAIATGLDKSPYFKGTDYDFVNGAERTVYIFEEEEDGILYQGDIRFADDVQKPDVAWNFNIFRMIPTPSGKKTSVKIASIKVIEEAKPWFRELHKKIRIHELLS